MRAIRDFFKRFLAAGTDRADERDALTARRWNAVSIVLVVAWTEGAIETIASENLSRSLLWFAQAIFTVVLNRWSIRGDRRRLRVSVRCYIAVSIVVIALRIPDSGWTEATLFFALCLVPLVQAWVLGWVDAIATAATVVMVAATLTALQPAVVDHAQEPKPLFIFTSMVLYTAIVTAIGSLRSRFEEKRMKDLAEERDRLEAVMATLGVGVCLLDEDERVVLINREAMRLLCVSASQAAGLTMAELLGANLWADDSRTERTMSVASSIMSARFGVGEDELPAPRGGFFTARWQRKPVTHRGAATGTVFIFEDVTRLKRTEQALKTSETRYRELLDYAPDAIFVTDQDFQITQANKQSCELSGYAPGELSHMSLKDLLAEVGDGAGSAAEDEIEAGRSVVYEAKVRRADGQEVSVECCTVGLSDRSRQTIVRDVTQRQRRELQDRQTAKLESVGRLAAGIAHEINTPIQFVGNNVTFLQKAMGKLVATLEDHDLVDPSLEPVVEELPETFEDTVGGLEQVASIVRAVRSLGHPDGVEMVPVRLNELIEETFNVGRNEYKTVAEVELDLGEIPEIMAHRGDLASIFLNLLVNAVHAIEGRESGGRGAIHVRTKLMGDEVVAEFSDSGTGIPTEIRDRIFDPFFTTKEVGRGTGQGLALARSVVQRHGGSLECMSEVGLGTCFVIRIPVEREGGS